MGLAVAVAFLAAPAPAQSPEPGLRLAVKAAYLYKFAPFVQWPEPAFSPLEEHFDICIGGDDPFGEILDEVIAYQAVQERPIRVKRIPVVSGSEECETMYVSGSRTQTPQQILGLLRGQPVLTVTDSEIDGAEGIIHFVVYGGNVRFKIDARLAAEGGIVISSKMLSLAVAVRKE